MGPEANIDSIRALERQIEEGKGDVIKLKRDRNSLLNISTRVPPETLGDIFAWCLVRGWRFEGLRNGSYNFLLVCHHWFEVASHTPELWSFWGNTLGDWRKRHHRSGATPLDLVLGERKFDPDVFDESLQNAVRSHVMQDTVRQVHLSSDDPDTLVSIISALTPGDGGGRNENTESIALHTLGYPALDVSNFFTRSHLSRLRSLDFYGNIMISSWGRLITRTTLLTSLSLDISISSQSPPPTAAQLFSILTSNPNLQELLLTGAVLPNDTDTSTFKVQLRHLKTLALTGKSRHLFGLLRRLILPDTLDDLHLAGTDLTVEDISGTLAPYMQDYFRRDARFQGRLGVCSSSSFGSISIWLGAECTWNTLPVVDPPRVMLGAPANLPPPNGLERIFISLIALIPRERVVFFDVGVDMKPPEEVFFMMPNIETLHLSRALLSQGFLQPSPDGPHADKKLLPSLRSLILEEVVFPNYNDWDPLTTYLAHQTSGGQAISLEVINDLPHGCSEAVNRIRGLVKEFTYNQNPDDNDE